MIQNDKTELQIRKARFYICLAIVITAINMLMLLPLLIKWMLTNFVTN